MARLSFWVPPERMEEFERIYHDRLLPVLEGGGLITSNQWSRPTVDSVFCRLFEVEEPVGVARVDSAIRNNPAWTRELRDLGGRLGIAGTDLLRYRFVLYSTPAGSGRDVAERTVKEAIAGPGTREGSWLTFDISDGLGPGRVSSILQDSTGSLWFATWGGVSRYDGFRFATFTAVSVDGGGAHDNIRELFRDRDGNLWLATASGVSRYDGQTWTTFRTVEGLAHNSVQAISQDGDGDLWFGTQNGVSRYDGSRFVSFTVEDGLARGSVNDQLLDSAGNLWFASAGGVSRYDGAEWTTFTVRDGLADDEVRSIFQDREGNLWCATAGGINRYSGTEWGPFIADDSLADDDVQVIFQDRQGDFWFGTQRAGLTRFDGEDWETFTTEDGLANDQVSAILEDRAGGLWIGTHGGGVSRYDEHHIKTFSTSDGLCHNLVLSLAEDGEGNIWLGTADGVSRYNGRRWTTFSKETTENGLADNWVRAVFRDSKDYLWFGTARGGVSRYDGRRWVSFSPGDIEAPEDINFRSIAEDGAGHLWFGTSGEGVSRYDGRRWKKYSASAEEGLVDSMVFAVLEDRSGFLWFGTSKGVSRFNGSSWKIFSVEEGLAGSVVHAIIEDRFGALWFGTERGVNRFDGDSWTTFTTNDGLGHDMVLSIAEDSSGKLWFATFGGGVTRYDGRLFQTFQKTDGLAHNAVQQVIEAKNGDFWIGTEGGVTRYRPHDTPPEIHLTSVMGDPGYVSTGEINLSSAQDYLHIEFQGASMHTRPERMVYVYRLWGHQDDWTQTREQQVKYADLPTGDYEFQVRAVDLDLNYSEEPATLRVVVHPPYVQLALAGGLIFALIGLAVASRMTFKRRGERDRAREERDQAREALVQELEEELQTAHDMQMGLMPRSAPQLPGFDIAGRCLPANHVGGDFFQFYPDGDRLALCMADVTGHAMEAAIPMVMFCGILENQMEFIRQLEELFTTLNRSLHKILDRRTFVCFTMGELDPAARILTLANGGNPYPYHYRASSGEFEQLKITASPLGMRARTRYGTLPVDLEPGDRIVFISDGIPEAENAQGEIIGFERTAEIVRQRCAQGLSSQEVIDRLIRDVKDFTGEVPQGDDMTFIVLSVEGE